MSPSANNLDATATGGPDGTLTIQWTGDISLNGCFCDPQQHGQLAESMAEIAEALGPADIRMVNFESPLWGDGGVNVLKTPRVATTRLAAESLLPLGFDVASLANNHAFDCLEPGFENTVRFLEGSNIAWLGAGRTEAEAARPLILKRRGLRVGILAYVSAGTNPNLPPQAGIVLNWLDQDRLLAEVASLSSDVDVVVVHLHWGALEMVRYPTVSQRRLARRAIEAGAAVVVGGHTHCLQGHETWKHGHIFYGMGNFLFGPLGAPGRRGRPWPAYTRRGAVATCVLTRSGVESATMTHVFQDGLTLRLDPDDQRDRKQRRLNRKLSVSDKRLARIWRREAFYQRFVAGPLRLLCGRGLLGLLRIRPKHLAVFPKVFRQIRQQGERDRSPSTDGQTCGRAAGQSQNGDRPEWPEDKR